LLRVTARILIIIITSGVLEASLVSYRQLLKYVINTRKYKNKMKRDENLT
jgi:hypothetical protein